MKIEKIQFENVRYNPEHGAFETLVKIHDGGDVFSYPAQVAAPLYAEYGLIARGLMQAARNAHKAATGGIRLQHATPTKAVVADASQKSLLSRLLGNAAA
ncbi:hypothetical protein DC366_06445 [Pelagivirga sediminicola]|uniref:Orotidine 5-phosphate decarboxylase n=1 Tax=Pelagivirga sediminicola TaxID=2170575 RepID=A0A2T7G7Z2_9RHOB|nr:hypothetical protein [Pelagivirga sediminicola]PVA10543.1 hypothetical protein DC366_06445 [Pelagivirga sediminicola]